MGGSNVTLSPPSVMHRAALPSPSSDALPTAANMGRHGSIPSQPQRYNNTQNNSILDSIQSTFDNIGQQLKNNDMIPPDHIIATFISGTCAFYATAFSSQLIQHKILKMSTGTRPILFPISVGAMTVALGSWMGHLAGLGTTAAWGTIQQSWKGNKLIQDIPKIGHVAMKSVEEMARPMKIFADDLGRGERRERKEAWMHAARICILGLITYKTIFRSNFISISPSSYTARGSFARIGIPAPPNFNYATRSQRAKIESIGKWWGCHTCGSRMIFSNLNKNAPKFHGDHIPPVSVAKQINNRWYRKPLGWKVSQKFYSQCRDCSNKQGGLLAKAVNAGHKNLHRVGGGEESYFHGRRLRIGHLTGGAIAVLSMGDYCQSSSNGNEHKLVKASRDRVKSFQDWIEELGRELQERVDALLGGFR